MGKAQNRVLIYGLGVTGIASAEVLMARGEMVDLFVDPISDRIKQDEQMKAIDDLNSKSICGELRCYDCVEAIDWAKYAYILKSPGIRMDRELIVAARANGLEVITDIELAYRLFGGERMIAVTGSNGKTTTVSLIKHLLNSAGLRAEAVGNIGTPILSAMAQAPICDYYVVECSSFQLSSVAHFAPRLSAILNLTPDHLEWHRDYEEYVAAKFNIAQYADRRHPLFLNAEDPDTRRFYRTYVGDAEAAGAVRWIEKTDSALVDALRSRRGWQLFGEHNVENALFAVEIARELGLSDQQILTGLAGFKPVAHRMESIAIIDGVEYINDSKGTNVDATVRALAGLERPILLIAGGYDKKVPFDALFSAFRKRGKHLILMGETAEQLEAQANACGLGAQTVRVADMDEAVRFAYHHAESGDAVLLSPASASWDMYPGYTYRGDDFRRLVAKITEERGESVQNQGN